MSDKTIKFSCVVPGEMFTYGGRDFIRLNEDRLRWTVCELRGDNGGKLVSFKPDTLVTPEIYYEFDHGASFRLRGGGR